MPCPPSSSLSSLLVVLLGTGTLVPGAGGNRAETRLWSLWAAPRPGPFSWFGLQQKFLLPSQCNVCAALPQGASARRSPFELWHWFWTRWGPHLPTGGLLQWFRASRCSVRKASVLRCEPALESLGERVWAGRGENWPYPSHTVGISKSSTESAPGGGAFSVVAPDHTGAQGTRRSGPHLSISPALLLQ